MSLRAFLEHHWSANAGRKQGDMLRRLEIPAEEISQLGAERVANRQQHWRSKGDDPDDDPGSLWMDGFIAGASVAEAWDYAP